MRPRAELQHGDSTPLTAGEASALFFGGRVTGCSRDRSRFWPVAQITYAARLYVPGTGYTDVAGRRPLRHITVVDAQGQSVEEVKPAPVGSPCVGVWVNGAVEIVVFGEQVAGFVCAPSSP